MQGMIPKHGTTQVVVGPRRTMAGWTNELASKWPDAAQTLTVDTFASLGDDHRLEPGFEGHVSDALDRLGGVGIVYGTDTHHGENLATSAFVSRNIVDALGWMIPPTIGHLYCDNAWIALGRAAGCLAYVPELRIPHNHPAHDGVPFDRWDATYREATGPDAWERDGKAFDHWRDNDLAADAAIVRALRS